MTPHTAAPPTQQEVTFGVTGMTCASRVRRIGVVTNALRLRRFRKPSSAGAILRPSIGERVGEYAYLAVIALVALGVGAAALLLARPEDSGTMDGHGSQQAAPGPQAHTEGDTHMEQMPRMISAAEAGVRVELIAPPNIRPNTPARLTYRLADLSGQPITDVVVSHEQPMHLIAVRRDLAEFQHVHPQPTGRAGEYAIEVSFPSAGSYILYDEFTRANGQDVLQRDELTIEAPSGAASLGEDTAAKAVGNVRVSLHADGALSAGHEARLIFQLVDATTGRGLTTLKPYLGAAAHVVILPEDAGTFAHTHGEAVGAGGHHGGQAADAHGGHGGSASGIGPEVAFHHTFPAPGLYKVWGQLQTADGQVITADFVVRVS